eukprot:s2351_g5.t1
MWAGVALLSEQTKQPAARQREAAAHVRQDFVQFGRLTRDVSLPSSRKLKQGRRVCTHRNHSEHSAKPLVALRRHRLRRAAPGGAVDPDFHEPRKSGAVEFGVGLAPFASGCVLHGGRRAGVRARPCGARPGDGADDRGIDRELGNMPHGQAISECFS